MSETPNNNDTRMLITADELALITASMARQNPSWAECDMAVNTVDRTKLAKCLDEPLTKEKGRHLYHGVAQKVSALFYMLLKEKPFKHHNDRIAVVALAYVMDRHAHPMKIDQDKLFDYARWMKLSPEGTKKEVIMAFGRVLE